MADPKITRAEIHEIEYDQKNVGPDETFFNAVYRPGTTSKRKASILRLITDAGVTGEYLGRGTVEFLTFSMIWPYLKGKNALEREKIYDDVKRALRQLSRVGIAPVDNALWDLAGKFHDVSIYKLLGGYKTSVPCYASTFHADSNGGLDSPQAYADFAVQCKEKGYPAFKIHGWNGSNVAQEIENIQAVRKAVGEDMQLMIDPACELTTFADALRVGWACDEARFLWYEDPFRDGGISQFGHKRLRHFIRTPLLLTEHVRSLEPHIDFALADATDFVRGDVSYDGITATMKLAHACEALGIDLEIHAPGPEVRQCMAAIRNTNYYEMALVHPKEMSPLMPPGIFKDYRDDLDAVDARGHVPVPQGPGLGVEINWDMVKRLTISVKKFD